MEWDQFGVIVFFLIIAAIAVVSLVIASSDSSSTIIIPLPPLFPLSVESGGTDVSFLPDHSVVISHGTNPFTAATHTGTAPLPLVSTSSTTDPLFTPTIASNRSMRVQPAGDYTLVLSDSNMFISMTTPGAPTIVISIPNQATVPFVLGTEIQFVQTGLAGIAFSPISPVTILSQSGSLQTAGEYCVVKLKLIGADTWLLYGNLLLP